MNPSEEIAATTRRALAAGSLKPLETRIERVEQDGVRWIVRVVERLSEKPAGFDGKVTSVQGMSSRQPGSPWLPPEPALLVRELDDYRIVLNKFPVIENHALIVTRNYADQSEPLTISDLDVLWTLMASWPAPGALGFYNGGRIAGASQGHKHLQVVPLPLAANDMTPTPLDPLATSPPFRRAIVSLHVATDARELADHYAGLFDELGLDVDSPYNLLLTRQWMMLVPRSLEHFENISINALGFAGCLLARNSDELNVIREQGPARILAAVT